MKFLIGLILGYILAFYVQIPALNVFLHRNTLSQEHFECRDMSKNKIELYSRFVTLNCIGSFCYITKVNDGNIY